MNFSDFSPDVHAEVTAANILVVIKERLKDIESSEDDSDFVLGEKKVYLAIREKLLSITNKN